MVISLIYHLADGDAQKLVADFLADIEGAKDDE
jgi:hypothetical protein